MRSKDDIQKQYSQVCMLYGRMMHERDKLESELKRMMRELKDLNQEYADILLQENPQGTKAP